MAGLRKAASAAIGAGASCSMQVSLEGIAAHATMQAQQREAGAFLSFWGMSAQWPAGIAIDP